MYVIQCSELFMFDEKHNKTLTIKSYNRGVYRQDA